MKFPTEQRFLTVVAMKVASMAKAAPRFAKSRSISAVKAVAGRGRRASAGLPFAAAFLGIAFLSALPAAPAAAQQQEVPYLQSPDITSRPASGDTYMPTEVIVVRVRPVTSISGLFIRSMANPELKLNVGGSVKTVSGRVTRDNPRDPNRLEFRYTVQKGDRDTDGVSVAANALTGGALNVAISLPRGGGTDDRNDVTKNHPAMSTQSGHKVDTPAPSFSGVTGPAVLFYVGASVNYRLPAVNNAADVYNLTYSVTPALPDAFSLDSTTATITNRQAQYPIASAQTTYTLRATDGFSRTADLAFTLEVKVGAGIEKIEITSLPGADKTYGKVGRFGTDDTITVRVSFTHDLISVGGDDACLTIWIGSNNPRVCNPSHTTRSRTLTFSYAVQASDWDRDGISFPTNPMGAGREHRSLQWRLTPGDPLSDYVTLDFASTPDDANHQVRGQQTTPTFLSTPAYSWVRGNAVSQVLPEATDGDGGVTYAIGGSLPAGLSFAAATRTISGTPTTTQGATTYTMTATDADGDSGRLRFSIEIEEIAVSISSPSVAEGAAGATATLEYDVTLHRVPGRQVTVAYAAAADPGTATSGTDYTAITGGTLTFAASETSQTFEVTVTGDALDEPDETVRIALSNPSGAILGSASTGVGTITDDDPTPTLALALSDPDPGNPDTINESGAGNATTVTASLSGGTSGEEIVVTVSATGGTAAAGDFSLSSDKTLTIAAGATTSSGVVTVTALDDATDEPAETATVGGTVAGGHGLVTAPSPLTLTIADDDARPRSALALMPASISESGGVTTVTATLSNPSANAVTVTVSAAPQGTEAVEGDFELSAANTLTIAAGQTTSAGTVTVTAVGNTTDSADKSVTVSGEASGTPGAANPPDAILTIRDDDGPPTVSLVLSSSSVSEDGGVATVTAALNGTSSQAVMVTVSAAAVAASGAVAGDFDLSTATTLTIAANAMTSTGTVTITANDNAVDSPHKRVTVSGTASGGNGIAAPTSLTLTLADDEATPTTRLALSPASIAEASGVSTVTATLSGVSSEATTITVSASPGAGTDFTLTGTTLTIEAGDTTSTGTVTVTAEPDTTDSADKRVAVSGAASGGNGAESPSAATLTIRDDDALPTLTLLLSALTINESGSGNVTTVTAALSHPSGEATTITVSASPGAGRDFTLTGTMLTIAAGSTASAGAVTITAVNNATDAPDKEATVSGAATGGRGVADPTSLTFTVEDDDDAPGVTLSVSPASIAEDGGTATVTATLTHPSSAATTVTVTPVSGFYTAGSDVTIEIAAGETANAADTALVAAVNDDVHQGTAGRSTTVTGTAANTQGAGSVTGASLTLTDDETLPMVTLALSSTSIGEDGGVSTVTATLSVKSSEAVVVTVGATAGTGAVANDFSLSSATTLTIAAGNTTSSGAVTVTANDNSTDAPNKEVTVSGTASGGNGVAAPSSVTLTLEDDDVLPTVMLSLSRASVDESGANNAAAVTAELSHPSSEAVTVTVSTTPVSPAETGDFTRTGTTLTIAAGTTTSSGTVTVTANDNDVSAPNKAVTVSGTAAGGRGVENPADVTLTIIDDEALPTVTLALSSSSISEGSGVTTVTAALFGLSSAAVTVTVSAAPASGAVVADYALSMNRALVIAAGSTASAGTVTLTAVNNDVSMEADKTVTVSGAASGGNGVSAPANLTLTITDNDGGLPAGNGRTWGETALYDVTTVSLLGKTTSSQTISISTDANAALREVWVCATRTVAQSSSAAKPSVSDGCRLATGTGWSRTISLTQAMLDNDGVVVIVVSTIGLGNPAQHTFWYAEWIPVTALPKATLSLSPSSVWESRGVSVVTATLDKGAFSAATLTVAVSVAPPALAGDFALSAATTLTFAKDETASTGIVTITGVNNVVDTPDKRVTVSAAASGDVRAPPAATLTLRDDDEPPTPTLVLSPSSISESGGVATVTAVLSHPSGAPTTITVSSAAGAHAAAADFTQTGTALTVPAGRTESTGAVTITARGNAVDSPDKTVAVSGSASNRQGVSAVTGVTLAIADDDATPTAALALMPASISENGGVSTVTATLSHTSSEPVTITVTAAAVAPAIPGDFTRTGTTLTIAAGRTESAGAVTITANDNNVNSPDKQVAVSGSASGGLGVANPPDATLAIRDDDVLPSGLPAVSLVLSSSSISENGGVATLSVVLSAPATTDVEVLLSASPNRDVAGYSVVTPSGSSSLTITAGETASTDAFVITGVDDSVDSSNKEKEVIISGRVPDGTATRPAEVTLTLVDDEPTPAVSLALAPSSISESGGVSTVTATLSGASSEAVTVTVSAAPGTGAAARDFTLSAAKTLTIAARSTVSTGVVTLTAVGNAVVTPDKQVTVSGAVAGGNGASAPNPLALTLEDDDARPTASLVLSSSSISENGGVAMVTAALSYPARAAVTVTVSAAPVSPAVATDFTLNGAELVIAAGETTSTGTVRVTAHDNNADAADKTVTVSGTASGGGVADPADAALTLRDDDGAPTVSLVLSPASIAEAGGVSTVTATLSGAASATVTVTVSAAPGAWASTGDFTLSSQATLTIAAGSLTSTGAVTVTANANNVDSPDGTVTVSGSAAGGGVADPTDAALTLRDDDDPPEATLSASPASISENGGVSTVTATLSHPSSAVTKITVTPVSGAYTVDPPTAMIVIQAGRTENAADAATIFAVDDAIDEPDRRVTVTGTMANDQGAGGVTGAALTMTDDEAAPGVTLAVTPASIAEADGVATVTATLSGTSTEAVTVTVTPVAGAYDVGADATIVIAAGETANASDVATVEAKDNAIYEGAAGRSVTVTGTASSVLGANAVTGAALTMTDDDAAPGVTLAVTPASISENGGVATVSATLSQAVGEAVTVTVTPVAGAYDVGSDATIVIAAGQTTSTDVATVEAVDNDVHEGSAGRSTTVTGTASRVLGANAVTGAALTLTDDDLPPEVSLVLSPASISEDSGVSTVSAALSHPATEAVTVTVSAAPGAGAVAADFTRTGTTLTIAAGDTTSTGTVTVSATASSNDGVHEPDRSVTVSATATGGNGVTAPSDATLTIADDEALPTVTLVLSPSTVVENDVIRSTRPWTTVLSTSTVTATLSGVSSEAVTVTVSATAVAPATNNDFSLSTANTLTIAAGSTTSTGTVTMTTKANNAASSDKKVTVSGAVSGGNGVMAPADATLTITDDEGGTREVTLFGGTANGSAWEGRSGGERRNDGFTYGDAGRLIFLVALNGEHELPITIDLADGTSGTATPGVDYTSVAGRTLTFPPGTQSVEFSVTVLDDDVDESRPTAYNPNLETSFETVVVELRNPVNVTVRNQQRSATLFILDDDEAGLTVVQTQGSTRTTEAGGEDSFTVALSSEPVAAVTVAASIPSGSAGEGEMSVDGGATWGSSGTLTFTAATWNTAQEVKVRGLDDDADDGDAGYSITLDPDSAAASATPPGDRLYRDRVASATVAVTNADDDVAGLTVTETSGSTRTTEAGTTDTFTVALSSAPTATVTVAVTSEDPSEGLVSIAGGSTAATATLTFDATTWSTAQTVTVHGQGDADQDGHVSYSITLDPDSAAATATPPGDAMYRGLATVTVSAANLDDDASTVTLHLSSASIEEDGGAMGAATVTATLSAAAGAPVTVTVSATAVAPATNNDFALSTANTLTIAMGATASTGVVTVEAMDNDVDAPDKTVTVSATASGASVGAAVLPLTLTIADDDDAPTVTLAVADAAIKESSDTASETMTTVSATLDRPSSAATTITVTPVAGAYAVGSDALIVIAAGSTADASDTATVTAVDSLLDEADRSVTVTAVVSNDQGAGAVTGAALTLTDHDREPELAITNPASAAEGAAGDAAPGTLTFTVLLGVASGKTVTVDYADAGTGTATSGTDYAAITSGTLTFAPGDRSKTVVVTVIGDAGNEPDETVTLTLSNPMNARVSGSESTGTGVIVDDDTRPTLAIGSASVTEGDAGSATLSFPVSLSLASGTTVTVDYADAGTGTATSGTDYTALASGTLTILAGETSGTIDVAVTGDALDEPNETVVVTLSSAANATLGTATGTGTITDDDDPPAVSITSPSVAEGDSGSATLRFAVTLDAASGRQVTVAWAEGTGGTATAGTDYTALTGGTLTFAAGETRKTIDAAVAGDALDEPNETVVVTLSGPVNATLGTASGTGTITDDDPMPSVSIDSPAVGEGGTLSFAVTLSAASGRPVTVAYAEGTGGTATAGRDYTALASGTLTFAAGETSKTIEVAAWTDTRSEADETMVVVLSGQVNATLGTATGTGTISDDSRPSFAVSSVSRTFGVSRSVPTFTLPAATGGDGTLTYAMASLPAGLTYTPPGARDTHGGQIAGTPTTARGETVYRLTATDRDGDAATLNVSIAVSTNPGITRLRVVNTRGGSPSGGFTTGQFIRFRFRFDADVFTYDGGVGLKLKIGDQDREARLTQNSRDNLVEFTYQVQASDWDGDGISIPRRPFRFFQVPDLSVGVIGKIVIDGGQFNQPAIYDIDARTKISFSNTGYPRINDRSPSFGGATIAAKTFVKGVAVWADDPALPAATFPTPGRGERATDVNSPVTYTLSPTLPAGLDFAADTRTITGTPSAVSPTTTYALTATDVDGDRALVEFALTVAEDTQPAFAADASTGYAWTEDAALSQLLPAASSGNLPVSYALTGPGSVATLSLPVGLSFDVDGMGTCGAARTVCGTPTAVAGAATYTLTATDRDGDEGSVAFAVTITPRAPDQVTGVTTTPAVDALRVDWTAAAKANGYKVQWKSGTEGYDPATRQTVVSGGATTTYTITGLTAGTDYTVRVISTRTGAPDGAASAEATGRPTDVFLALSRTTIEEDPAAAAGTRAATVTAHLTVPLSTATTVRVSATAGTNAAADDFTLSSPATLIIAAGVTASTGTVTITAVNDNVDSLVDDGVSGKNVVVSGVSSGVGNPADLNLLITEDDRAALVLNPRLPADANDPWLTVAEGETTTFTVALASEPTANMTVAVSSGDDGEGKVSSGGGAPAASTTLTFTAADWNTAQTVTLTGAADDAVDGDEDYRLTLDPSGASTDAYDALATVTANARTTNADAAGLVLSKSALTVTPETGTAPFTLALLSRAGRGRDGDGDERLHRRRAGPPARVPFGGVAVADGDVYARQLEHAADVGRAWEERQSGRGRRADHVHAGPGQLGGRRLRRPGERDAGGDGERRRPVVGGLHRRGERERGRGGRDAVVPGHAERGERPGRDGGLCGRGDGHGDLGHGLHGPGCRHADLRRGGDEPDRRGSGDGRRGGRRGRDGGRGTEQPVRRHAVELGGDGHGDDHRRRPWADGVHWLGKRDGGRRLGGAVVPGHAERGE